jgi:hypothetical protein
MKSIEEIKKEILLKIMRGERVFWYHIVCFPKDDGLRSFLCELGSNWAYSYAYCVDKCPHEETRKASYRDPYYKQEYIDKFGE